MTTPEEAVSLVRSGDNVFIQGAAATPTELLEALCARQDLEDVTLYHLHTDGPAPMADPCVSERIRSVSLFTGPAMRRAVAEGRADFVPVFLKDIPGLFTSGAIPLDVALVHLSPPDRHNMCSLGTSVDTALAATRVARSVIAQVNPQMPRVHGYGPLPLAKLAAYCEVDRPIYSHEPAKPTPVTDRIGALIANLVEDGSCLQTGIGAIPDAVLARLTHCNDLGVHTEMFGDGVANLMLAGNITNARKSIHPGRSITSFVMGSQRLYDFVDDNVLVEFHPCDHTNNVNLIRKIKNVVAINSALQIDLTGQVCADSIGHRIYSGIGGQMDFMQGASLSEGGKPILALPSTAAGGTISRIVPELTPGAGVVTTRGHVHWVVTEYGAVNLHGRTLRERAEAMISLAHPDFRESLREGISLG